MNLFRVPKLYENMDEATIGMWLVQEGDLIEEGTELIEFVTDKTTEIYPSPFSGTLLKIFCQEKSTIPVSYIIAAIGEPGEVIPDVSSENESIISAADPLAEIENLDLAVSSTDNKAFNKPAKKMRIAPAARAFAKKHGLDLDLLAEHFAGKMIHKKDLENYLKEQGEQ